MSDFSERITDLMNKRHITQKQLAQMANVTESAMSYYVNGTRTPRIQVLSRLAGVLGVSTDYLLGANSPEPENETMYQYLQRNLEKLSPEQLDKAARILKTVFEDVFDDLEPLPADPVLRSQADFLYEKGNPDAEKPAILKSYSDIKEVDKTGILFTDGSRISFQECSSNSLSKRCVAARYAFAGTPYMEFLTSEQPTRLVFCSSNMFSRRQKNYEAFRGLQIQIESFGYSTYDLG